MNAEFGTHLTSGVLRPRSLTYTVGRCEGAFEEMGFDRGRRGRGRDKRDRFGEDDFDPFFGGQDKFGGNDRFSGGGGGERFSGNRQDGDENRGGFGGGGAGRGGGAGGGMPAQVVGEGKGTVKFFNSSKGFGFIQREEGGEDIFVHISAVERAGLEGLAEGQELQFTLVDRGGKVSASDLQAVGDVLPVEKREAPQQRELTGEKATGTVKFFNTMKGFGFITRDDGQADAFVHISAVERSGLTSLNEGDRVEFDIEVDRRGKYSAVNLVPC